MLAITLLAVALAIEETTDALSSEVVPWAKAGTAARRERRTVFVSCMMDDIWLWIWFGCDGHSDRFEIGILDKFKQQNGRGDDTLYAILWRRRRQCEGGAKGHLLYGCHFRTTKLSRKHNNCVISCTFIRDQDIIWSRSRLCGVDASAALGLTEEMDPSKRESRFRKPWFFLEASCPERS